MIMTENKSFRAIRIIAGTILGILSSLLATACYAIDLSIAPAIPTQVDMVRVLVPRGVIGASGNPDFNAFDPRETRIEMTNNRVLVSLLMMKDLSGEPSMGLDLALGQLPPGEYVVEVSRRRADGTTLGLLGEARFAVRARSPSEPIGNHTDLWWDPAESGWGIGITHHGSNKIFAVWYAYGDDRKPIWYVLPDGTWTSPTEYRGTAYRTSGPPFIPCSDPLKQSCFDASSVNTTPVGSMTLSFHPNSSQDAAAVFDIEGQRTVRLLKRQSF
jgi:hypothetical protein